MCLYRLFVGGILGAPWGRFARLPQARNCAASSPNERRGGGQLLSRHRHALSALVGRADR